MITICATPKPFEGHIGMIQENAIKSWLANDNAEVILCGDEKGVEEMARKHKVRHIPNIEKNELGTPLLDDIFYKIQREAKGELICYVSADVMLFLNDFDFKWKGNFFGAGYRYNANVDKPLVFDINFEVNQCKKYNSSAMDYWIFPKGMFQKFPAFTVGRGAQEGWIMWYCKKNKIPTFDFTGYIVAIHQNHDYRHITPYSKGWDKTLEFERNIKLAGGFFYLRTLRDVDFILGENGVETPKLSWYKLFFSNPFGQFLLGLRRLIRYYL